MIRVTDVRLPAQSSFMAGHVLSSGHLAGGEYVKALEQLVAAKSGTEYAVAVNSGTSALQLALEAETEPGWRVAIPAMTFAGTANAVYNAGCIPVIVDVGEDRLIDASKIPDDIDAVMPVHLYGQLAPTNYPVCIEDAAQAIGHQLGTAGISLYGSKTVTTGEGGLVVTNDAAVAAYVALKANQGQKERYEHITPGFNMRMSDLSAAIAVPQMLALETTIATRRRNADYLWSRFHDLPVGLPHPTNHTYHQFVVEVDNRDEVRKFLKAHGVETGVHYPVALSQIEWLEADPCPVAERLASTVLSLPVHENLTSAQLEYVAKAFREAVTVSV